MAPQNAGGLLLTVSLRLAGGRHAVIRDRAAWDPECLGPPLCVETGEPGRLAQQVPALSWQLSAPSTVVLLSALRETRPHSSQAPAAAARCSSKPCR